MTFPLFFIFYFTKYHLTFSHGPKINMRAKCNQSRCDDSSNFAQEVMFSVNRMAFDGIHMFFLLGSCHTCAFLCQLLDYSEGNKTLVTASLSVHPFNKDAKIMHRP